MIKKLVDYYCPINNILKEIENIGESKHTKRINDSNFIKLIGNEKTQNRKQATKVENIVKELNDITKFINNNDDMEYEDNMIYYNYLYEEYMNKLRGLNIKQETISLLLNRTLARNNKYVKNNTNIKTKLINMLYKYNKQKLLACFIKK